MLSEQAIKDFQKIYREEHGELLSDELARSKAEEVMRLFIVLTKPIKEGISHE